MYRSFNFLIIAIVAGLLSGCISERDAVKSWRHSKEGSYAVAISPDKRYALVGSLGTPAKLWDIEANKIVYAWQNETGKVGNTTSVAFSPDGSIAATCESKIIVLWKMSDGKPYARFTFPTKVKAMALAPEGDALLLALANSTAIYFDVKRNGVRYIFEHDDVLSGNREVQQPINAVAISPDGQYAATGGDDDKARLWSLKTGKQVNEWKHGNDINLVKFSPNSDYIVSAANNDQTKVWALPSGKLQAILNNSPLSKDLLNTSWADFPVFKTTATAVGITMKGDYIVTGHPDRQICVWSAKSGANIDCWKVPITNKLKPSVVLQAVQFSHDGRFIYSEAGDGMAQKWRVNR